jgi:hypothetical protein
MYQNFYTETASPSVVSWAVEQAAADMARYVN